MLINFGVGTHRFRYGCVSTELFKIAVGKSVAYGLDRRKVIPQSCNGFQKT